MKLKQLGALGTALALTLSMTVAGAAAASFSDIENHWGREDIEIVHQAGLANGYPDGTYKPDAMMTAAETLLFCARVTGIDADTRKAIVADRGREIEEVMPGISWAVEEMALAVETGVLSIPELQALAQVDPKTVNGTDTSRATTYLLETITREKICMYLVRAMQLEPLAKSLTEENYAATLSAFYPDAGQITPALRPYIYVLHTYGIVKGTGTGFDPKGAVTRATMTTMLRRAMDFMKANGIVVELSEYTDYAWRSGTVSAVQTAGSNTIVTLENPLDGSLSSYSIPNTAKFYQDNMLSGASDLKVGRFIRLNLDESGTISEVRINGVLTAYSGTISSLAGEQLTIQTQNGGAKTLTIDRFTQVMAGKVLGDRTLISEEADYSGAVAYVDDMGHLAAVSLSGGTQAVEGLLEKAVSGQNGETELGITRFNGMVDRYTVPSGSIVTVDNSLTANLTGVAEGSYVQVRLSSDSGQVVAVTVNTGVKYIQGPIRKFSSKGTVRSVTIANRFTDQAEEYILGQGGTYLYNGTPITPEELEQEWYVTARVVNGAVTELEAYPASVVERGILTDITYGATTVLRVSREDGSVTDYALDVNRLPTILRNGKSSSIDKLVKGDNITVTLRYNKVEKIDTMPQTANLTGTITAKNETLTATTITVQLTTGQIVDYTLTEGGVSVTQNGAISKLADLRVGQTIALVTNGGEVSSIDITAATVTDTELVGKVLVTNSMGNTRTMTVQVTDSLGKTSLVVVDVWNAKMINTNGTDMSLSSFAVEDSVRIYGKYENGVFKATLILKLKV